jgi:RHS repeat-associated protein
MQVEYYHTHALGSVRAVTKQVNGQWQVVARHDFMPFGEEVAPPVPPQEKRLFTGKERDHETGLDYFGARYYRADIGRFTTVDPAMTIEENLVDPQRWNRYGHAKNNPLRWIDPDGRAVFSSAVALRQAAAKVMGDPGLQPTKDNDGNVVRTYCNFGVQGILREGGDHTLDKMNAAAIQQFLADPANATELSQAEAVRYARAGATVVMAERGHVAVVAPEDLVKAGPRWSNKVGDKAVVKVFNVGKRNEELALDLAFNAARPPRAYILNRDKKVIDEQEE